MASCSVDSGGPTDFPHKKKKNMHTLAQIWPLQGKNNIVEQKVSAGWVLKQLKIENIT